jgi:pimeloyl-ACP methyl ester carboxylesterase
MTQAIARDLFIEAPGGKLFVRIWGGPDFSASPSPVVLLHDSLGCVELWRDFPKKLAAATGRPVIAYDRLGYGKSDPREGRMPLDFIRQEGEVWLRALRAQLGLGRVILFGHSIGGGMAVAAGASCPDDADAVVAVAGQAFVEDKVLAGIRKAAAEFRAPGQLERLARYHGDKAEFVFDAWVETWLDPAFAGWTLDEDLRQLRCPLLALHGDRDEYGSNLHPQRMAALAASGQCVILPDCGHVPHREMPKIVAQQTRDFLVARGLQ